MASQPDLQTIAIHILPNTNQAMKFGQLIEYNKKIVLLKNHAENEAGRLVPDLFSFFKKVYCEVEASGLQFSFIVF